MSEQINQDQAKAQETQERAAWIEAHGSRRLRRLLAEGIEHTSVYLAERLAVERPGWRWQHRTPGVAEEPRNCPVEAFGLLDEARLTEPQARLVWWVVEHSCSDECGWCGLVYVWRGYAAQAQYMGREILYGVPADVKSYRDHPKQG